MNTHKLNELLPKRLQKIYMNVVRGPMDCDYFQLEEPPRNPVEGLNFYAGNPKEFYARYSSYFDDDIFSYKYCPRSYSKKKVKDAKEAILKWIFN